MQGILFFFELLTSFSTFFFSLLLIVQADCLQRILGQLHDKVRILNLGNCITNAQCIVFRTQFQFKSLTDGEQLSIKLQAQQVGHLQVIARCKGNGHGKASLRISGVHRKSLSDRIHVGINLCIVAIEGSESCAIRTALFHTFTSHIVVAFVKSVERIDRNLKLEASILLSLFVILDTLDQSIDIEHFAHLNGNVISTLTAELSTQHIGELLVVRSLVVKLYHVGSIAFGITSNKSEGDRTQRKLLDIHSLTPYQV